MSLSTRLNKNAPEWALQQLCFWGLAAIVHLAQHCTCASAWSATAVGWLRRLMLIKREAFVARARGRKAHPTGDFTQPSSNLLAHGCWAGTALSLLKAPCLVAGSVAPCAHTAIRLVHTSPRWWRGRRWGRTRRRGRRWGRTRGWSRRANVAVDPTALCVGACVDGNPIAIFTPRSGTIQHPTTYQRAAAVAITS